MSDLISRADAINTLETEKRCTDREEDVSGLTLAKLLISALPSADTSSDLISRANAIRWVKTECNQYGKPTLDYDSGLKVIEHLKKMPSELPSAEAEWIPFKKRPLTDEEKQEYPDWTYIFDCPLPDDEEEILLSNGKYVWTDTFINDGECYLDGGDDIDDGMAWMPLPEPYREDGEV